MKEEAHWTDQSDWPRRLLHVKTLTSHERQPGDKYAGVKRPAYTAISYTWGRFQVQSRDVEPMPIKGTTWEKYLPRIDPARFRVHDMLHMISALVETNDRRSVPVEFVWLDIACIDQTPGSDDNADEVGRQAGIFRQATDKVVWLWTLDCAMLEKWLYEMEALVEGQLDMGTRDASSSDAADWVVLAEKLFKTFTEDPWFSSLWTLQEAFLSPTARFIFKDGLSDDVQALLRDDRGRLASLLRENEKRPGQLTLHMFVSTWQSIMGYTVQHIEARHGLGRGLADAIATVGFIESVHSPYRNYALDQVRHRQSVNSDYVYPCVYPSGQMGNPFRLLVASRHRRTTRMEDRVYGIMQIFGLRLGKSAPGAAKKSFALEELEEQLSTALLEKYPIFSQLVAQDQNCRPGTAWMMNPLVNLTRESSFAWDHYAFSGLTRAVVRMSTAAIGNETWASFAGLVTSFGSWRNAIGESYYQLNVRVGLDGTRGLLQDDDKRTLESVEELQVLMLGYQAKPCRNISPTEELIFRDWGLVLFLRPTNTVQFAGKQFYLRMGFGVWHLVDHAAAMRQSFSGVSEEGRETRWIWQESIWQQSEGFFG